jgi:hypothetical protein
MAKAKDGIEDYNPNKSFMIYVMAALRIVKLDKKLIPTLSYGRSR